MRNLLKLSGGGLLGLFLSCGPQYVESWSSSEEFPNANYEDAWSVVVSTVTEEFNIETIDGASGYLKTTWKTTPSGCATWYGLYGKTGVMATIRVDSRTPFRLKIKVEKGHYDGEVWTIKGIDNEWAARLLEKINGRLQKYK